MKKKSVLLIACLLMLPTFIVYSQTGSIIAEEHFVENDKGWNLGNDNDVVRKIENGKLTLECKKYVMEDGNAKNKGGYWLKMPESKLPASNYSVTFTTRWKKNMKTDDTYAPYGMKLGDFYFLIYGDGDRRLLQWDELTKKYITIVDWGVQSVIYKKDIADNRWEIRVQDGKAAFYANGSMLYKKGVYIPAGAAVNVYIESSEVVEFDDIVVRKL